MNQEHATAISLASTFIGPLCGILVAIIWSLFPKFAELAVNNRHVTSAITASDVFSGIISFVSIVSFKLLS